MAAQDSLPSRKPTSETHHGRKVSQRPAALPKPTQPGISLGEDEVPVESLARRKEYPSARKYEPPDIPADAPLVIPGPAKAEPNRRRKIILLAGIPVGLILVLCLFLLIRALFGGNRISDKEAVSMLENLRIAQ